MFHLSDLISVIKSPSDYSWERISAFQGFIWLDLTHPGNPGYTPYQVLNIDPISKVPFASKVKSSLAMEASLGAGVWHYPAYQGRKPFNVLYFRIRVFWRWINKFILQIFSNTHWMAGTRESYYKVSQMMTSPLLIWCTVNRTTHNWCYYSVDRKGPEDFHWLVCVHWLWFILFASHNVNSFHIHRYLTSGRLSLEGFSTFCYGLQLPLSMFWWPGCVHII